MYKFTKNILLLTMVLLILASALNFVIGKRNKESPHYKLQYDELVNNKTGSNCIILGTSHATHGIRPSYLNLPGISVYNFALNGSTPEFYFKWYTEIFQKTYQKPEYIIYCIDWFLFDDHILLRRYEQDAEHFPFNVFIKKLINIKDYNNKSLLLNRFPIIKYKEVSDLIHIITNVPNEKYPIEDYDRGFIPYEAYNPNSINYLEERISSRQVYYFENLMELLTNDGIKIIFVNIPEFGDIDNYKNKKTFDFFNEIANKHSVPILNYNIDKRSMINQQRAYYSDWMHLNGKGSSEFSKLLSRDLAGILTHE